MNSQLIDENHENQNKYNTGVVPRLSAEATYLDCMPWFLQ